MKAFHYVVEFNDWSEYKMYNINWSMTDNVKSYSLEVYSNIGTLCVL